MLLSVVCCGLLLVSVTGFYVEDSRDSGTCKLKMHDFIFEPHRQKTYILTCAPNVDSNQPTHLDILIRVFIVRMKKPCILWYVRPVRRVKILIKQC